MRYKILKRSLGAGLVIVIGAGALYLLMTGTAVAPSPDPEAQTPAATETFGAAVQYSCADGKAFTARFAASAAEVTRGSEISSLQFVSSDDENGTQFANPNADIALWVREESAFILQNGTTTYAACRAL